MSPRIIITEADVRLRYVALLQYLAELTRIRYDYRPSTRFEEIREPQNAKLASTVPLTFFWSISCFSE